MTIPRLRHTLLVPFAVSMLALGAGAQPVIDLDAFASCTDCSLRFRPMIRLGEASGDGIIEADLADVRYGNVARLFAVFQRGGSHILLFDSAGRFVRRIGRG